MSRPIVMLAHVGTSILQQRNGILTEGLELADFDPAELTYTGHNNPLNALIEDKVALLSSMSARDREDCSAEFKSCSKILAALRGDRISHMVLVATDTPEGALAAELHRRVFEQSGICVRAEIVRPTGLQVRDAQRFRQEGLPEYIKAVYDSLKNWPQQSYQRVFNPTGGFKALVPYLTVIAMLEGVRMAYIFEWSDQLVELPAFPVKFDDDMVQQAIAPLRVAVTCGAVSQAEIEEAIGGPLRGSVFDPLFQHYEGDEYMASALGEILHARQSMRRKVLVSSAARSDLAKFSPVLRAHMHRQIEELADPCSDSLVHGKYAADLSDLFCRGTGRSLHRIFYGVQGSTVYVARIFAVKGGGHDAYEAALNTRQLFFERFKDYKPVGLT